MKLTRSRFHSFTEYQLTVAIGLVAAVWATAVSRWVVSDLVVPWDSKNQFYAFFRFLSALSGQSLILALEKVKCAAGTRTMNGVCIQTTR